MDGCTLCYLKCTRSIALHAKFVGQVFWGFMILQVYMLNGTLSLFLAECSLPLQITRLGINSLFEAEETSGISCKTYASLLPTLSCQL